MLDFAKTAEASFLSGPPKIQKYGRTFLINVIVCLVHFQGTAISILYASTLFQQIGNFHSTCYQSLRSATLFLYALHNVTMTMPLENRMRTPHNLQRMLILNVSFNVFIVHDIRVPRLQQMHARCLRHCSQESSQESVDVPYAKIRSIFIFLKNFTLMKFKTSVILIQSLK
ncbi:uncharacterized protein LOC102654066 isoform X2 [Apis mellifera]|uniref:Uncharacterized protein LOC102654066 isoform X2 n=1 Tax=Apis mellifera TaxID=7460 RepID=A0A7M7L2Q7_APIME|nr:uncharacterized protein LOC102654066 isoform X2 [Apis mellifera]XP_026296120.1 uncharacterized protein LOC102654066 isoform X2 [Apis mellifera]|eukprot:XP_026296119.1 uncharacterized protein LOC102654066 isoform X2 [Apis mellifera]